MRQLCVIFDLDGTLCDTSDVDDECYQMAAAAALGVQTGTTVLVGDSVWDVATARELGALWSPTHFRGLNGARKT
jgi:phosphoglycolate phosphatase-like HAD superfamily hydrolase